MYVCRFYKLFFFIKNSVRASRAIILFHIEVTHIFCEAKKEGITNLHNIILTIRRHTI